MGIRSVQSRNGPNPTDPPNYNVVKPVGSPEVGPAKPLFICHVIWRLGFGGLENGLVNLINNLPWDGYRHAILSLKPPIDLPQEIRREDVEVFNIEKREGKDFAAYARVWKLLRELKPDVVHTRNFPALDMLAPAALAGVRCLVHGEHGLDIPELDGRHARRNFLRRLSRHVVTRYIAVSRDLAIWLNKEIRIDKEKISLIYNGVDTERFSPSLTSPQVTPSGFAPPGAFVIGTIGRLAPVKDQVNLAKAFVRMLELRPELRTTLRLIVIGEGSLREQITATLVGAGAEDLAWMPGFCSDTPNLYRSFDVFTLPAQREGISNTILEAMASGLPIVATRVGGTPEIVRDGATGQLVPPNDPDAFAAALLRYIDSPNLVTAHGKAGRLHVMEKFSLPAMVSHYDQVYQDLRKRG